MSIVICLSCHYRWLAVRPLETKLIDLECGRCGMKNAIETGEIINE